MCEEIRDCLMDSKLLTVKKKLKPMYLLKDAYNYGTFLKKSLIKTDKYFSYGKGNRSMFNFRSVSYGKVVSCIM